MEKIADLNEKFIPRILIDVLAALDNKIRLSILIRIDQKTANKKEVLFQDILDTINISKSLLMHHLNILIKFHMIEKRHSTEHLEKPTFHITDIGNKILRGLIYSINLSFWKNKDGLSIATMNDDSAPFSITFSEPSIHYATKRDLSISYNFQEVGSNENFTEHKTVDDLEAIQLEKGISYYFPPPACRAISLLDSDIRRAILIALDQAENNELSLSEIYKALNVSKQVAIFHLNLLREGMLIDHFYEKGTNNRFKSLFKVSDLGNGIIRSLITIVIHPTKSAESIFENAEDEIQLVTHNVVKKDISPTLNIKEKSEFGKQSSFMKGKFLKKTSSTGGLPSTAPVESHVIQVPAPFLLLRENDGGKKVVDMESYHDTPLVIEECSTMYAMEEYLGNSIPSLKRVEWDSIGFASKNGHVLGLGLFNAGLKSLPEKFGALQQLQWLGLAKNMLSSLPGSIANLKSLETLILNENQIEILPASVGVLKSLVRLDLHGNRLHALPNTIGNLTSLVRLDLSDNGLNTLPESIMNLVKLQFLLVAGNPLEKISPRLEQFIIQFQG